MPIKSTVDSTFGDAISANKFCGVDEVKVLADKNWVDFFLALSGSWTLDLHEKHLSGPRNQLVINGKIIS
jgi:hypothetical protein